MSTNIILETKFVADISGSFYIPSYQRGYRWSETEVVRLLDDIYQNGKKNYCLQPVVVRKKEDQYELIDGQQRLTTLYLIYKYMKNVNPFFNEPAFTLSYQTRDQSEKPYITKKFMAAPCIKEQDIQAICQILLPRYKNVQLMQGLTNNKPDFRIQVKGLFGTEEKRFEVVGGDKKRSAAKKKSDLGWIDRLEEIDAALDDF